MNKDNIAASLTMLGFKDTSNALTGLDPTFVTTTYTKKINTHKIQVKLYTKVCWVYVEDTVDYARSIGETYTSAEELLTNISTHINECM